MKQLELLGFEDLPALRRAILQSEAKNPAVTMYHTISRNMRNAGKCTSTNSTSDSSMTSVTDSATCDSHESGNERKVKSRSNSREGNSKRKSIDQPASLPASPTPDSVPKKRHLTQSTGPNNGANQSKATTEMVARHHQDKKNLWEVDLLRHSHNPNASNGTEPRMEHSSRRRGNTTITHDEFEEFVSRTVSSPVDAEVLKKIRRRSDKPVSKKREEKEAKDKKEKKEKKSILGKLKKEKFEAVEEEITVADLPAKKEKKGDKKKDRRKSESSSRHRNDVKKKKEEKNTSEFFVEQNYFLIWNIVNELDTYFYYI